MRNDNFMDFGDEISRTIRKVLTGQEFYDLKNTINRTMGKVPGMGGGPFGDGSFPGGSFPKLSRDDDDVKGAGETYGTHGTYNPYRPQTPQNKSSYPGRQKGGSMVASTLFLVFGSIGAAVFGIMMPIAFALGSFLGFPLAIEAGTAFGVPFLAGVAMIFNGLRLRKRAKRFRAYEKVLGGRTYCTVKELALASRQEPKFIVKDLRKMIRAGMFPEGYLDEHETCLMTDYATYTQYLETMKYAREQQEAEKLEKQKEAEKWANRQGGAELKETIDEGRTYIRTIKAANDALPEAEISEKLDRLELVTGKIFDYVEHHPEKLPEIRKFMSYYMPITLKLVNAYQRFERHGTHTSEIEDAKLEIKGTLDTINKAYLNLLHKLMEADILDVSSDISALETILAQEGLTGEDFKFKPE